MEIGTSRSAQFETDPQIQAALSQLSMPDLPVFQIVCNEGPDAGEITYTSDPANATLSGLCTDVGNPSVILFLNVLFAFGWLLLFVCTFLIDHFDLFGLKRVWRNWREPWIWIPSRAMRRIALGMACWGRNAFKYNEETLRAFSATQQLDPRGFTANLLLGYIESQYQRFDDAVAHLGAAIAADASAPEPWYQLGMNAYEQSRDKEASKLLSRYVSLAEAGKNGKPAQLRQGWNLLQKRRCARSLSEVRRCACTCSAQHRSSSGIRFRQARTAPSGSLAHIVPDRERICGLELRSRHRGWTTRDRKSQ